MSRPKNPVCRAPHAAAGLREAQEVTKFSAPCDKILLQNTQPAYINEVRGGVGERLLTPRSHSLPGVKNSSGATMLAKLVRFGEDT